MEECKSAVYELIDTLKCTTSAPATEKYFCEWLQKHGFEKLDAGKSFNKLSKGKYYTELFGNTIVAFTLGEFCEDVKIIASHIDNPSLVIKPNPDVCVDGNHKLNVEVYGGPILNTWFDRPLSVSGRVMVKEDGLRECIVDFKRPILTIPNLAIHLNRDVNKGVEINRQKDMMPILSTGGEEEKIEDILAKELNVDSDKILDYELYVYNCEDGRMIGINEDMILAPRLDNITSSLAAVKALVNADIQPGISMVILYDNEEVGSRTKQGAASAAVSLVMQKICKAYGIEDIETLILNGKMISVDVAHAKHPNYVEKSDPTNTVALNKGIVIKKACSQSYATDSRMSALVKVICEKGNIPYQVFVNASNMQGGSTLGSIASTFLPMQTVDIGIPVWGMHSSSETGGVYDLVYMEKFLTVFLEDKEV